MTSLLTIDKIFKCLSSLPLSIQESLWWWQCSVMYSFPLSLPTGISIPGQYILGDNSLINKEPNLYQILSFRGCAYQHTFCLWCSVLPPPPNHHHHHHSKDTFYCLFLYNDIIIDFAQGLVTYNFVGLFWWLYLTLSHRGLWHAVLGGYFDGLMIQGLVTCSFGGLFW